MTTTPTAGAMRAANHLFSVYFIEGSGDGHRFTANKTEVAQAIDRETGVSELLTILARLTDAADRYAADQSGAVDARCGLVQPISVAEGVELNEALEQARKALKTKGAQ